MQFRTSLDGGHTAFYEPLSIPQKLTEQFLCFAGLSEWFRAKGAKHAKTEFIPLRSLRPLREVQFHYTILPEFSLAPTGQ